MRAIFVNGQPRAGKDIAAQAIVAAFPEGTYHKKFAAPLERTVKAFFDLGFLEYGDLREKNKGIPSPALLGKSMREVMISLSEDWAKKFYNTAVFGTLAVQTLPVRPRNHALVIFSDCGFQEEVAIVADHLKRKNCLILQVTRDGCSYEGDSRNFIELEGVELRKVQNLGSKERFQKDAVNCVKDWIVI